jgi:hypothetical protein
MNTQSSNTIRTILAIALIIGGVMWLTGVNLFWPMFVLVPGAVMLAAAFSGEKHAAAGLAIPGALVTGTGALLFVQNLTGYWESWSYAWTLYGVFLGIGLMILGSLTGDRSSETVGRGFVRYSLYAFIGVSFLMEMVFKVGGSWGLWPIGLILAGGYLVWATFIQPQSGHKAKTIAKPKRSEKLFTGPIVYGSRRTSTPSERLSVPEAEAQRSEPHQ